MAAVPDSSQLSRIGALDSRARCSAPILRPFHTFDTARRRSLSRPTLHRRHRACAFQLNLHLRRTINVVSATTERNAGQELPCLAAGGGGIFFFWQLGALQYIKQHFDPARMQFVGASAGALIAVIAACDVDPEQAVDVAYKLAVKADLWSRRLGLLGIWGGLIREWLDLILPDDASERCRKRLKLIVTDVLGREQLYLEDFDSRADLINAGMASIHIPILLDYKPFSIYRGRPSVDGSLTDFLFWENGKLLTMEGRSFVLDYSQDQQLSFKRFDFVRLRSYDSVMMLVKQGYDYAARVNAKGGFEKALGAAARGSGLP